MKELLDDIDRWRATGARVAIARVVDIEGSGPRLPGAAMAVNEAGEVTGSVTVDAGHPLTVEITRASAEALGLAPGMVVAAVWKATATRLVER